MSQYFSQIRISKMHLRFVTNTFKPWITINSYIDNICEGIQCDLIKYLARSANFTYEFIEQRIGTGIRSLNGSWTGAIGRIDRNEADITGFPIAMTVEPRLCKIVDHTVPFFVEESVVMIRFDGSWSSVKFEDLIILDKLCWTIFGALFFFVTTLLIILNENVLVKRESLFYRILTVSFQLYGSVLERDIQPRRVFLISFSTLFIISAWLVSAMQLSIIMSSEITARFSLKIPVKQIDSLKDLVESNMSLVVYPTFMNFANIQDQTVSDRIKAKIVQDQTAIPIPEFYKNNKWTVDTSEGMVALFFSVVPLKMIAIIHSSHLRPKTRFHFIEERYRNPFLVTIAMSTRLPQEFRTKINFKVLQYESTGLIDQQLKMVLAKSDRFFDHKEGVDNHYKQINMDNLFGLYKIILICWAICMLLIIGEIFVYLMFS